MIREMIRRWCRGEPPRSEAERQADLRAIKWMQLISSTSLIIALIIWMVWLGER
jgi:flagellar biogenesis protein FliO